MARAMQSSTAELPGCMVTAGLVAGTRSPGMLSQEPTSSAQELMEGVAGAPRVPQGVAVVVGVVHVDRLALVAQEEQSPESQPLSCMQSPCSASQAVQQQAERWQHKEIQLPASGCLHVRGAATDQNIGDSCIQRRMERAHWTDRSCLLVHAGVALMCHRAGWPAKRVQAGWKGRTVPTGASPPYQHVCAPCAPGPPCCAGPRQLSPPAASAAGRLSALQQRAGSSGKACCAGSRRLQPAAGPKQQACVKAANTAERAFRWW